MLKKSSRTVSNSSTQGLMAADPFTLPSPAINYQKPPGSPLFPLSPRHFASFSPRGNLDLEFAMSPTSILETKPFAAAAANARNSKPILISQPIGLGGIVDTPKKTTTRSFSRMVLFGSRLKIQIPSSVVAPSPPQSPIEFGVKNKESQLALLSPALRTPTEMSKSISLVSGCLSASEMEMSEDYTCVIAHGPNPKTTHIFDNCVVESRMFDDFLTCCHACKKRLGQGEDIFMYRYISS